MVVISEEFVTEPEARSVLKREINNKVNLVISPLINFIGKTKPDHTCNLFSSSWVSFHSEGYLLGVLFYLQHQGKSHYIYSWC